VPKSRHHAIHADIDLTPKAFSVRQFTDYFASAKEVLAFSASSSFGNVLRELPPKRAGAIRAEIVAQLDGLRTQNGIPLERNTIFAVAEKT